MDEKNSFINSYKNKLIKNIHLIDNQEIMNFIDVLEEIHTRKSKIFVIGNGGSFATSEHMVNDLLIGLGRRNIRSFDIESLGSNNSVCMAIANDIGYENIFYAQVKNRLKVNDLLIAISCSGNSRNILKAVDYTKLIGAKVASLTGFDGGELKKKSDITFHVPTEKNEYGLVEDLHMIFNHIIYSFFIDKYKT